MQGTQYNGMRGFISSPFEEGRFEVQLSNEAIQKRIKPENLKIFMSAETPDAPESLYSL